MIERSLKMANVFIDNPLNFINPNNKGTVKGAMSEVIITILIESAIFPLTISVRVGDATPAGMAVRRRTAIASFGLNKFTERKNNTGIKNM